MLIEALPDFYFATKAYAAGPDEDTSGLPLNAAAEAWAPIQEHIGDFGGFWRLDLPGLLTRTPEAFEKWAKGLDESIASRSGGLIPIRSPALQLASAMQDIWPDFRELSWPAREARLTAVVAELDEVFVPHQQAAFRFMLDSLNIEDPNLTVPLYLVTRTNPPGAMTYRSRQGPLAVFGVEQMDSSALLMETILHEVCHALDGASGSETNAFAQLRILLETEGVTPEDPRWRSIPHLLMFVQAEETMRRLYDPNHMAYGDTPQRGVPGVYARSNGHADVIRSTWREALDGKISRDQALSSIVHALVPESQESQG